MRLVGTAMDCYNYLEPLYNDYRKIRRQNKMGSKFLIHTFEVNLNEFPYRKASCKAVLVNVTVLTVLSSSTV